jgi:hypothetical protein
MGRGDLRQGDCCFRKFSGVASCREGRCQQNPAAVSATTPLASRVMAASIRAWNSRGAGERARSL